MTVIRRGSAPRATSIHPASAVRFSPSTVAGKDRATTLTAITGHVLADKFAQCGGVKGEPHARREEGSREGEQQGTGGGRPEPGRDGEDEHRQQPRGGDEQSGISTRILQGVAGDEDAREDRKHGHDGGPGTLQRRGPLL